MECNRTFDGKHHYAPRQWGSRDTNNLRTVIACLCGQECPERELEAVKEGLEATALEQERQRFPLRRPGEKGYGKPPRYVGKLL